MTSEETISALILYAKPEKRSARRRKSLEFVAQFCFAALGSFTQPKRQVPRHQYGYLVVMLSVVFLTDTDELPILSDLDLDLLASRFPNVGLVYGFALFHFLGSLSNGAGAQVVLNGLLHCCRHVGQRYLLLVFFPFLARIS